jgi:hypothetical protein
MGTIDGKKGITRSEEKGCDSYPDTGGGTNVGLQSAIAGDKSERIDRADGAESNFFSARRSATGGILSQLIEEYRDQVAVKRQEIDRLEARISEFEGLQNELQQRIENES